MRVKRDSLLEQVPMLHGRIVWIPADCVVRCLRLSIQSCRRPNDPTTALANHAKDCIYAVSDLSTVAAALGFLARGQRISDTRGNKFCEGRRARWVGMNTVRTRN